MSKKYFGNELHILVTKLNNDDVESDFIGDKIPFHGAQNESREPRKNSMSLRMQELCMYPTFSTVILEEWQLNTQS